MRLETDQKVEFEENEIKLDIPYPSTEGVNTSDKVWKILSLTPPVVSKLLRI